MIHLLLYLKGKTGPKKIPLQASTSIGRMENNVIQLLEDPLVSRQHALISEQTNGEYSLIDLGSSNGTYINGQIVLAPTILKHDDEILIGGSLLKFQDPEVRTQSGATRIDSKTVMGIKVQDVVIMVGDIRGFTRISEELGAEELTRFIGGWFKEVASTITESGGIVDKYIGDAFMAYWILNKEEPTQIVDQALEVARQLILKSQHIMVAGEPFRIGIGMHSGVVASGNLGTSSQRDASIMGDTVNVTFRIESMCKEFKSALLISEEVFKASSYQAHFSSLGPVQLKGKSEEIVIYAANP